MADEEYETEQKEQGAKVSDYVKKFTASEKTMRAEFLPKYQLAKERLRAEHEVKGRGTRKLTHEQVNLVQSIGSNFVNSVYFKSPHCNLTAREYVETGQVENTEIAVNDWLKDKKVKKVIKRAIWDAYLGGFGCVFIDYDYDDMDDPERPLMRIETVQSPEGIPVEQEVPEKDEQGKPLFERIVLKNEITIQRIRPDLVRFPKGFDFDNHQESPWIGFDLILPIDEVKNNENWDKDVREKIQGERYEKLSSTDKCKTKDTSEGNELYAKISYVFKKPDNPKIEPFKLCVFCQAYDEKPLTEVDFKKGHSGYPLKFITFNPLDDDCSYPNGDPWNFESQLNAVDIWWQKLINHVRRSNPKIAYDMGAVNSKEAQKMKSNNDNELVGLSNKEKRDIRTLFAELNAPEVNKDLHRLWEVARELLDQIAPKAAASQGSSEADTATEAKIIQAGEMIDVDARIDDVRDFVVDIVLDTAGIMSESLAAPLSLEKEVEGSEEKYFEEVGSEGFTGKLKVDVDVESMQSQNKDVLRRHLIQMLELFVKMKPITDAAQLMVEPKFWIEKLADTAYIRNIDKGFMPMPMMPVAPPDPDVNVSPESPEEEIPAGEMPMEAVEAGMGQRI